MSEPIYAQAPCPNCGTYSWRYGRICPGCKELRWELWVYDGDIDIGHLARDLYYVPPEFLRELQQVGWAGFKFEADGRARRFDMWNLRWLLEDLDAGRSIAVGGRGNKILWHGGRPVERLEFVFRDEFTHERISARDFPGVRFPGSPLLTPNRPEADAPPTREPGAIDYADIANRLRKAGKRTPAMLVEYMADKSHASPDDIAFWVHGNAQVSPDAIRKNVERTNDFLAEIGSRLSFRFVSERVFREISPE